ncbi:hypothetical protein GR238_34525 [Rhizobium leguminosarum]|uniref:hypothetical protein n=1 Tax=Rhizobium ruizarguesonis TaxID=2081791 RepID=UPI0013B64699|nr:hypothetical protein [Rhizobium ruizarguesonis]NEJ10478.1 hypothetical protein [Rhizobium ruizarguesonis]
MAEPEDIRIDELPPFVSAQPTHQVPAMLAGASGFLTIGQIMDITVGAPPADLETLEKLIDALGADGADGPVVGVHVATYGTNADLNATIPLDDTIPQNTEGTQILSLAVTPKKATNKLLCMFFGAGTVSPAGTLIAAMFKGAGNAIDAVPVSVPTAGNSVTAALAARFVPGSTASVTVSVRVGAASGVARMNGNASGRLLGGAAACVLIVKEIMSA